MHPLDSRVACVPAAGDGAVGVRVDRRASPDGCHAPVPGARLHARWPIDVSALGSSVGEGAECLVKM